jgi:hypothetical protein
MGVGSALNLLGGFFEKIGWDKTADIVRGIGTGFMVLGSVASALAPVLDLLKIKFTSLGITMNGAIIAPLSALLTTVLPIIVAIGAIAGAVALAYSQSPEGKLKKAKEYAEEMEKGAQNASQAFEELNQSLTSLEDKYEGLKKLTQGTAEWKKEVSEVN